MKTITEAVIDRINYFLGENMTQYTLAQRSEVPYPTIKSIMQRRTKDITLKTLLMLVHGFGINLNEFFDDESFHFENLEI